jgi:ABC-type nitrate/sulfonate/bicarbonate transport system ATPase subunit
MSFSKFKIRATSSSYNSVAELHDECGRQISFKDSFDQYEVPINFLNSLKNMPSLAKSELYKYFCKVTYQVLNQYDKGVSGGERAEFNLLKALHDARQFEMLLIDEPESSFDNLFLKESVNKLIKDISKEMPVIVVTHNNTVGMLLKPEFIIYTKREIVEGNDFYKVYSGSPGDKKFKTTDNEEVESYNVLMSSLEAGEVAYKDRESLYKNYK